MNIVIGIPKEDYEGICNLTNEQLRMLPIEVAETLMQIANGTPLPERHERLIDAGEAISKLSRLIGYKYASRIINECITIIGADKGSDDKNER